jgi:hypothetical protein
MKYRTLTWVHVEGEIVDPFQEIDIPEDKEMERLGIVRRITEKPAEKKSRVSKKEETDV